MSDSRSAVVVERLESSIVELLVATASFRAPVIWCVLFAAVLNSMTLFFPSWQDFRWTVPLVGGCGFVWLIVVRWLVGLVMPTCLRVSDILAGLGFAVPTNHTRYFNIFNWLVYAPLLVSMIPGWIGAMAMAAFIIIAVMFIRQGQAGLTRAATAIMFLGGVLVALAFAGPKAVSVGCGAIALASLFIMAIFASSAGGFARELLRVEATVASAGVLVALPLAFLNSLQSFIVPLLMSGVVVVPVAGLLLIFLSHRQSISRCRRGTTNLRAALESPLLSSRPEDEVRESDGYFRVCEPRYSHARPLSVGEAGYIGWPEHDSVLFPIREGEWCLSRAITSSRNPLLSGHDAMGEGIRKMFEQIAVGVAASVGDSNLETFISRINRPWHLRLFRGHDESEYLKMPWESGEVLAVPRNFTCSLVYPTGCGIVDKDGLPCEVRSVRVQLTLQQAIVSDFDSETQKLPIGPDGFFRPARDLIWRVPLIVPGVYEGILRVLGSEMKKWRTLEQIDQASLLASLVNRRQQCLGEDLSSLVELQITSVDVVQGAVSEQDRDIHRRLYEARRTMPGRKTEEVRRIHDSIRAEVYLQNEFFLKAKVDRAVVEIEKRIDEGVKKFHDALASGMKSKGSDGSETSTIGEGVEFARSLVDGEVISLKKEVSLNRDKLIHALNEIDQAFKRGI